MFVTDFAQALPIPAELEFMAVSSYGSATSSSGVVRILKDLDKDITGRRVLIVEDIIDSGLTLSWLLKNLHTRNPASIEVVALLRKPEAVKVDVDVRYVGFDIPNEFVVGYGLDYAERYRDLPVRRAARPEDDPHRIAPAPRPGATRARRPTPVSDPGNDAGFCFVRTSVPSRAGGSLDLTRSRPARLRVRGPPTRTTCETPPSGAPGPAPRAAGFALRVQEG